MKDVRCDTWNWWDLRAHCNLDRGRIPELASQARSPTTRSHSWGTCLSRKQERWSSVEKKYQFVSNWRFMPSRNKWTYPAPSSSESVNPKFDLICSLIDTGAVSLGFGVETDWVWKRRNLQSRSKEGILDIKVGQFFKPEDVHASLVPGVCGSSSC